MDDRWLSVEEMAEYLGVSKDTIYTWIDAKGMPAHRLGRLWKFKREQVDAWVKTGGASDRPQAPKLGASRRRARARTGT